MRQTFLYIFFYECGIIKEPVGENNLHLLHDGNKDIKIYSPRENHIYPEGDSLGNYDFSWGNYFDFVI